MNVFVVPSWYPNRLNPIEGIFNREHALAIGAMRPQWNVAVSFWGQTETVLRVREPWRWPQALAWSRDRRSRRLSANVTEYRHPALLWSDRFLHGRRDAVVAACRKNLRAAERDVGHIDVIHALVTYPGGWAAMKLSEETGIPYVISEFMGGPFPFPAYLESDGTLRDFLAEPLRRASVRMGVSPMQIARMEELGVEGVELVPLAVDEELFSPGPIPSRNRRTFLTVALLIPDKGIGDLIEAAALVVGRSPDVEFRIRGDGDRTPWLAQAERLGIEKHIVFLDRLTPAELRDEYRSCDAFVLSSHHEAGSTATIEAIACGRPVVATRCGAPDFIVTPDVGLLVDVGRPDQLAGAMQRVLDEPELFDTAVIRERFLTRFSRPVIVDRIEVAYRKAISGAR